MTETKLIIGLIVILISITNLIVHYYYSKAMKKHNELLEILKRIEDKLNMSEEKK